MRVRLTPKSSTDGIDGAGLAPDGRPALLVRVRALPEKGAANAALLGVLAQALKLPKSALDLVSGGKGRVKTVRVTGEDAMLAAALERLAGSF